MSSSQGLSMQAKTYGQALTATNAALQDPSLQTKDETLACIWLLSLYEVRTRGISNYQSLWGSLTKAHE